MRGVGDFIKRVTTIFGIEQCEDCKHRQEVLNLAFPFAKPEAPTDSEINFLKEFFIWYKGLPIPIERAYEFQIAEKIWSRLYRVDLSNYCRSCGTDYQNKFIKQLHEVYLRLSE